MNKLPLHIKFSHNYDPLRMQEELNSCLKHEWPLHFKTSDFEGSWKSISLRSASGAMNDILAHPEINGYQDTPLLAKTPYIKSIIDSWKCDKEAVRLLSLAPGSRIKPHKDYGCSYKSGFFRIHVPLLTNEGVYFTIGDERLQLQEGECWYMDFSATHSIVNEGRSDRVHLIIDGIRNSWTDELFEQHGYHINDRQYDDNTKAGMIAELERMDTDVARAIIANLK